MILIPLSTDAPVYHWPRATVSLIASCTVIYLATRWMEPDAIKPWTLTLGKGLHPLQWFTYNLLHIDWLHLIGNMIFLWSFGLIVEGKVGAGWFLAICAGVGTLHGAILQVVMLRSDHEQFVLGASVFIYGLLAIAMIWAPRNELNCFFWFFAAPSLLDIEIYKFAVFYIASQFVIVAVTGAAVSTELVHSSGALIGIAVGLVMLKADWVECENWDLLAVIAGRAGKSADEARALKEAIRARKLREAGDRQTEAELAERSAELQARAPKTDEEKGAIAARKLRKRLDDGDSMGAYDVFQTATRSIPNWQPSRAEWLELIKALEVDKAWRECVRVMQAYVDRANDPAPKVRLKLAHILISEHNRPAHAQRVLAPIAAAPLDGPLQTARDHLARRSQQMLAEGVLEVDGDVW